MEFWAKLGRSVEFLINGQQTLALCRGGGAQQLSRLLHDADSAEGRERVAAVLERQPFPHYRPYEGKRGLLERIEANGKRTVGRFVNREFKAVRVKAQAPAK